MEKKYSNKELNKILLSKNLSDFYIALLENRQGEILTDEEYKNIINGNSKYIDDSKKLIDDLTSKVEKNKKVSPFADEIFKTFFSFAQIRHVGILTMINDDVYDIGNASFVDFKKNKIIHYEVLTTYYNEENARLKMFTPSEEPALKEDTLLLDVDDETIFNLYEKEHVKQETDKDLTPQFFSEVTRKPYTLKRK